MRSDKERLNERLNNIIKFKLNISTFKDETLMKK